MSGDKSWGHGMTIRDVVHKIEGGQGKATSVISVSSPIRLKLENSAIQDQNSTSAYLGPKLWDNSFSISNICIENSEEPEEEEAENGEEAVFSEVMDMESFLAENNLNQIDLAEETSSEPIQVIEIPVYSPSNLLDSPQVSPVSIDIKPPQQQRPSIIVAPKRELKTEPNKEVLEKKENTFLYAESKRAKLEREKEERRKKMEVELDFAPEDLALATIPGLDFDPKERSFDLDELKPQPIIKKRRKVFVPDQSKDEKYWDKREKNNVAARRSREARRLKENQIALRAAFLESENKVLKKELDESNFDNSKLATEKDILKKKLSQYETFARK